MLRIALALGAAIALVGCATTVTPTESASPGTVVASSLAKQTPGSVPIIFKRDSGFMGAACSQRVYVNGSPAAELRSGQAVTLYMKPGDHIVGARPGGMCGGGDAELEIQVKEGRQRSYRLSSDQNGSLKIQPTAF